MKGIWLGEMYLGYGFHETTQETRCQIREVVRREVPRRLPELNHERYDEEVRQGLHKKATTRTHRGRLATERANEALLFLPTAATAEHHQNDRSQNAEDG
jgi:hypothetical protein